MGTTIKWQPLDVRLSWGWHWSSGDRDVGTEGLPQVNLQSQGDRRGAGGAGSRPGKAAPRAITYTTEDSLPLRHAGSAELPGKGPVRTPLWSLTGVLASRRSQKSGPMPLLLRGRWPGLEMIQYHRCQDRTSSSLGTEP